MRRPWLGGHRRDVSGGYYDGTFCGLERRRAALSSLAIVSAFVDALERGERMRTKCCDSFFRRRARGTVIDCASECECVCRLLNRSRARDQCSTEKERDPATEEARTLIALDRDVHERNHFVDAVDFYKYGARCVRLQQKCACRCTTERCGSPIRQDVYIRPRPPS